MNFRAGNFGLESPCFFSNCSLEKAEKRFRDQRTNRQIAMEKSTILSFFTRKDGEFPWAQGRVMFQYVFACRVNSPEIHIVVDPGYLLLPKIVVKPFFSWRNCIESSSGRFSVGITFQENKYQQTMIEQSFTFPFPTVLDTMFFLVSKLKKSCLKHFCRTFSVWQDYMYSFCFKETWKSDSKYLI